MQLNKEQHAKVFGLYMGSKVYDKYGGKVGTLVGVNSDFDNEVPHVTVLHNTSHSRNYNEVQLILTPLSEITDEDKIYLIKWCYNTHIKYEDPSPLYAWNDEWLTWKMISAAADYLRFKSYHVPYLGVDLHEAGIAIKPNEIK